MRRRRKRPEPKSELRNNSNWIIIIVIFAAINRIACVMCWMKNLPRRFSLCVVGLSAVENWLNCCPIVTGFYSWSAAPKKGRSRTGGCLVLPRIGEEKAKVGATTCFFFFYYIGDFYSLLSLFLSLILFLFIYFFVRLVVVSITPLGPFSFSRL